MPKDTELLRKRLILANLSTPQFAETFALETGLSPDSIRGRISRMSRSIEGLKILSEATPNHSDSIQLDIIDRAHKKLSAKLSRGGQQIALFSSDKHFPYARWDALRLEEQIIESVVPDYITTGNDTFDNDGFGRWDDTRKANEKLWSSDFENHWLLEQAHYRHLQKWGATLIEVQGNHDNWLYSHLRSSTPQTAESFISSYMQRKEAERVLQFSNGQENAVRLSPALVFWHGQFAAKSPLSNAKNTIEQFVEDGVASSVVVGHTHRPVRLEGASFGYSGVTFINSGCLSRLENIPYLKRDPKGWGLGLVVAYFEPTSRYHELHLINFTARGNALVANFNGTHFETELECP